MRIKRNKYDIKFSNWVRRNGKCERCSSTTRKLEASHYFSRAAQSTRYDQKNVFCLCFSCHLYLGSYPYEHEIWVREKLGKKEYNKLVKRWRILKPKAEAEKECEKFLLKEGYLKSS